MNKVIDTIIEETPDSDFPLKITKTYEMEFFFGTSHLTIHVFAENKEMIPDLINNVTLHIINFLHKEIKFNITKTK